MSPAMTAEEALSVFERDTNSSRHRVPVKLAEKKAALRVLREKIEGLEKANALLSMDRAAYAENCAQATAQIAPLREAAEYAKGRLEVCYRELVHGPAAHQSDVEYAIRKIDVLLAEPALGGEALPKWRSGPLGDPCDLSPKDSPG